MDWIEVVKAAVVVLVLGSLFALLVIILVRWLGASVRSHRKGDAPHCAKCDYNLTGSSGTVCPECGTPLDAAQIVLGEPGHDWPAILIVAFCLLIVVLVGGLFVVKVLVRGL